MVLRSGPVNGRAHIHLNQTTKDWHSRSVTLSEAKGLAERFFAALRMTLLMGLRYKVYQCPEFWFSLQCRVGGEHRCSPPPSEPYLTLSRHTAQAGHLLHFLFSL